MAKALFRAFVVEENSGAFAGEVRELRVSDLPAGDLLLRVRYSSLNYKDALSATGNRAVTRTYPHTPGIDAAGTVVECGSGAFRKGDEVIVTGFDLGMNTPGGFGRYVRVPAEWAVRLPDGMTPREAMAFGTAGLTAGLSVLRMAGGVRPGDGRIAVSGATGGVGSLAVAILSRLGYSVSAVSGKEDERDFLFGLGAAEVLPRSDFQEQTLRAMHKAAFAGAVDTVGGDILVNLLKALQPLGVMTCCGNAASPDLHLTVYPFILRGVSLIGIDSQNCPMAFREAVWGKLAGEWKPEGLMDLCTEISLAELPEAIERILSGGVKGRTIVDLDA
ncbi:oxidoreductase [Prosthecochloris sp. GSB1]|uniref:YhdH/YhfP family quinone oxidoreductase n=1 Tax=Prosthecochloris sp. GSB1 TaxID=281093 RepID=UPI000B8CED0C|nr:YhdH/YhfP family quinone oxidoreductase [Prosthecochloris sp. GSB1]ASQ91643.1 oxidoreductase [Prosthecochloris sp. GSB1]